jgi:hypothetical protein
VGFDLENGYATSSWPNKQYEYLTFRTVD